MILKRVTMAAALVAFLIPQANAQEAPAGPATTHVMVTLKLKPEERQRPDLRALMRQEVKGTVGLYLDGRISDWYMRSDGGGVVLIVNATSIEEAQELIGGLPFSEADVVTAEYIPLAPLTVLGMLLADPPAQ